MGRFLFGMGLIVCQLGLAAAVDNRAVEAEIKSLDHQWAKAYLGRDYATLERIISDDLVSTDATGMTFLKGKRQDIGLVKSGEVVYKTLDIESVDVRVHGDTAVAVGKFSTTGLNQGKPFNGRYAYTETWMKRDGRWQAVSEHLTEIHP